MHWIQDDMFNCPCFHNQETCLFVHTLNLKYNLLKVNCVKEETSKYCGKEKDLMKAYLFRGNILLREFPTDTLFDVNAIVAHVLL